MFVTCSEFVDWGVSEIWNVSLAEVTSPKYRLLVTFEQPGNSRISVSI